MSHRLGTPVVNDSASLGHDGAQLLVPPLSPDKSGIHFGSAMTGWVGRVIHPKFQTGQQLASFCSTVKYTNHTTPVVSPC